MFNLFSLRTPEEPIEIGAPSLWAESPKRQAGFRQTLTVGKKEYGFRWIPAGEFDMGSPESEKRRSDDERLHHVILRRGFWLLETPVTNRLYNQILMKKKPRDDHPVDYARYVDALSFCEDLTKRLPKRMKATLPTEAQWEYACRAGTTTAYYWGDNWVRGKALHGLIILSRGVKKYAPNPWGLYDMSGNVREWCLDWYGEYPTETAVDPVGPPDGAERVTRGGSFSDWKSSCRSASRASRDPDKLDYEPLDCSDPETPSGGYYYLTDHGFRIILRCD